MEIIEQTSLTENQIEQIQELQQYCMAYDGSGRELFLSNDINYHKDMPCFFLSYQNAILCGVLIVFAPTMETAEISAYVHPSHRRNGIFSAMLLEAWQVIHQFNITKVLMVTDAVAVTCKEILSKWQGVLSHSEYLLVYQGGEKPVSFPFAARCLIREAEESDLEKIIQLNMAGFGEDQENAAHMVHENFQHKETRCFVGLLENEIFGLGNVRKEGSDFYICGFLVSPANQGKGLGRFLLYQILKQLTPTPDESITLEVDSENQVAYFLYTTSGFEVQSQADYYRLELPIHLR
jgi:ribosomal protein S18 acetylase RimI-like enzyme